MKLHIIATNYQGRIYYFDGTSDLTRNIKSAEFYNTKSEADLKCHELNIKNAHNVIMQVGECQSIYKPVTQLTGNKTQ